MRAPKTSAEKIRDRRAALSEELIPFGCLPLVIEDLVSRWPATKNWTRDYLSEKLGDREVTSFVSNEDEQTFLQQVNKPETMLFRQFLQNVFSEARGKSYYLRIATDHPLFEELSKDFEIPEILNRYNPSATGIWIGQKGNVTPFHHDWWHSFLAQISGRKRYTLIHPFEGRQLQEDWNPPAKFDLSPPPVSSADKQQDARYEACFEGILEAGQILYIPPYWFHQVETLDNGTISIPMRFDTNQSPDVPLFQLSQESTLRPITNQNASDDDSFLKHLRENRNRFFQKEKDFIDAYLRTRDSALTPSRIQAELSAESVES